MTALLILFLTAIVVLFVGLKSRSLLQPIALLGTLLALVRPPPQQADGKAADGALARPPLGRSLVMIAVGLVAAIWGLASLLSG